MREEHADFWSALQFAHFALVQIGFDAQTVEEHAGIRFGSVAAFFADNAFEFAEAHAVFIGEMVVMLGVERVAFLKSLPEKRVAHDDRVDDTKLSKAN